MFTVRASTDSAKRSASFLIPQGCVSGVFYQLVVVPNTFDPVFSQNNYPRSLIGIKEEVPFCAGTKLVSDTQKAFPLVAAVSPATVGNLVSTNSSVYRILLDGGIGNLPLISGTGEERIGMK